MKMIKQAITIIIDRNEQHYLLPFLNEAPNITIMGFILSNTIQVRQEFISWLVKTGFTDTLMSILLWSELDKILLTFKCF